jgi:hypothetical protein
MAGFVINQRRPESSIFTGFLAACVYGDDNVRLLQPVLRQVPETNASRYLGSHDPVSVSYLLRRLAAGGGGVGNWSVTDPASMRYRIGAHYDAVRPC